MKDTKTALIWITDILKKHQIPFQISGGLAAIVYGATRPLADIDIDIPDNKFDQIIEEIKPYIIYGPEHCKGDNWDLLLMTLNYQGQEIDISGADTTHIFDTQLKIWVVLTEDLPNAPTRNVMGLQLPVIPCQDLINYKKILSRDVDLIDIQQIKKANPKIV